jgi:hypothetical protein
LATKKRFAILTILALLVIVTCLPFVATGSASGFSGISENPHDRGFQSPQLAPAPTISLSYQMSKTRIFVTVSSSDSQFPCQVLVTLSSSYNGTSSPYNLQRLVVPSIGGHIAVTFSVPYDGPGDYTFSTSVKTTSGAALLQASLDPRIDPDWR